MKTIYIQLLNELKKNSPLALATIIERKGSAPQIPGASALFSSGGLCTGTVGGGFLEADAQKKALQSLQQKVSLLYKLNLAADISSAEGSICGGEVMILIDARPEDHTEVFRSISKSLSQRQPGVLATFIGRHSNFLFRKETLSKENTNDKVSLARYWVWIGENFASNFSPDSNNQGFDQKKYQAFGKSLSKRVLGTSVPRKDFLFLVDSEMPYAKFLEEIKKSLIDNKPNLLKIKDKETLLFLEPIYPLPHLIIAGAGHIGQAVSHLGSLLDFEVTVIDDRPEFANKEKLPDADSIIVEDIGKAMQALKNPRLLLSGERGMGASAPMQATPISSDTYIVIVTRGHKKDADALRQCIDSEAAYIGMIGSARKIKLMRERFLQEGWSTSAQWDRIYAPIGIDIQSKTVQEIAVSIAAQLILVRRQKQTVTAKG